MMDFIGNKADFSLNNGSWRHVFDLAVQYGWDPAGTTLKSCKDEWCGSYFYNSGQRVTAKDARNLADARCRRGGGEGRLARESARAFRPGQSVHR